MPDPDIWYTFSTDFEFISSDAGSGLVLGLTVHRVQNEWFEWHCSDIRHNKLTSLGDRNPQGLLF